MKKVNLLYILLFLSFSACTGWLEEIPKSSITGDKHFSTYSGILDGLAGTYDGLRSIYGQQEGFMVTTPGTDIFTHGSEGGSEMDTYDARLNPQMGNFRHIWNTMYDNINHCNAMIERSALLTDATAEQIEQVQAEAYVIRAMCYWWLTQQYGDVPFRITETKEISTEATRESVEVILNQMVKDLEWAIGVLPSHSAQELGKFTKGAAQHLLAKIHLIMAYQYQQTASYVAAEELAKAVINSGEYHLEEYAAIFDYDNQRNGEVVFAVQFINNPQFNRSGNRGHLYFTPVYDKFPGLMRDLHQGGRPWSRFAPTKFYRELFDANDARFDVTFRRMWYYNTEAGLPDGKAIGDEAEWDYLDGSTDVIAPNEGLMHWGIKKHDDHTRASFQDTNGFRDYFVFRLGETYLILAEALSEQGKTAEAAEVLKQLRAFRTVEGGSIPEVQAWDIDLDYILDERARELGGEMHRWMDLVRTDRLITNVKKHNENAAQFIQDYHALRPIPQTEIDLVTTEGYEQNPGYPKN
ncbi:RagB/SusD family nutrient uptake outer membrane protein [Persicobacter sp. CCB-QB2]|uniref:RagB/SusD family nutrient uptake outer membrane protein n=1 Tax=Persicobacter sp. CCB-QB2 TaxID=1561025 RepID=UPI0006A955E7|nr:RagB/SusD family nutrient uptake outer membrane protein [Persicobacter sp. CCB-QB2]